MFGYNFACDYSTVLMSVYYPSQKMSMNVRHPTVHTHRCHTGKDNMIYMEKHTEPQEKNTILNGYNVGEAETAKSHS